MSFFHSLLANGQGEQAPSYTNWWQGIDDVVPLSPNYTIYDPLAAADLASSYVNLANPGTRNAAAPSAAPSHAQGSGWTFNGSTHYLTTGTTAKDQQTVMIWVEDAAGVYAIGFFTNSGGVRDRWIRPVSSSNTVFQQQGGSVSVAGPTRGGILAIARQTPYKNSVKLSDLNAWSGSDGLAYYIGCHNSNNSPANYFSGRVLRVAIYDFELSEEQVEAVTKAMMDYYQPEDDPYVNVVLESDPICYYPATQRIGSVLFDYSGNKAHGESYYLPVGQPGPRGYSVAGDGNANHSMRTVGDWATKTGLNLDEFSFSMWVKIESDASNQVRLFNCYSNSQNEYYALEVRTGLNMAVYLKETGSTQNSTSVSLTNNKWHHIVGFNSKSEGKYGFYLDGTRHEFTRTLAGYTDTSPDPMYPIMGQDLAGNIQHISFYDHALTQEEVDALNV